MTADMDIIRSVVPHALILSYKGTFVSYFQRAIAEKFDNSLSSESIHAEAVEF